MSLEIEEEGGGEKKTLRHTREPFPTDYFSCVLSLMSQNI